MRNARLDHMPLKRKLAMVMIAVMAVSFALCASIVGVYGYRVGHREMREHLEILSSAVGDNCSAALVFDDERAAREILSALAFEPAIVGAVLCDKRSNAVATFREGAPSGKPRGIMRVDRRIAVEGDTAGYLTIWAETSEIAEELATATVVAITGFLVAALVLLFVFDRMQPALMAPLLNLHDTIRRIVRSRDYSIRATRCAEDELNDVVMAFNDLLAQLEERAPDVRAPTTPAAMDAQADEIPVKTR